MPIKLALTLVTAALLATAAAPAQAAITVANTNDSGPGSLRQAIAEAPPGETINLPAGTYDLTTAPLKLEKSVTIAGHDDADTIVRSAGAFRVLEAFGPLDVTLVDVAIRDGRPPSGAQGGGIFAVKTNLALRGAALAGNVVNANGPPGSDGGAAFGGAIWLVEGSISMNDAKVTGNTVTAVGSSGKAGGAAEGGGIWMAGPGSLSVLNSTISGNRAESSGGQGPPSATQDGGGGRGRRRLAGGSRHAGQR